MTKEDVEKFIAWLKAKEMTIAGHTYNPLLGVYRLAALAEEDEANVIDDFLKEQDS